MVVQLPDLEAQLRLDIASLERSLAEANDQIAALGDEGESAGTAAGEGLADGVIAALVALPVAGSLVAIGAAIGASITEGLGNEVREDLLRARTGLDEVTAAKVGRAAGEAYANNFGESIEQNMDNARAAIQAGLLDPDATQRDIQAVMEQLQGVADIMGEEVPAVARAASQAIRTGIAVDAAGAYDLLVKGTQAGLNASEDLLDTLNEYGTSFRTLGLDGPEALGLLSQAVNAGARDTDIAADAFKEFSIRAQDGSTASAAAYEAIGLNAEEMTRRVAAGGDGARDVLRQVLEGIAAIEDPAERTAVAVGLFGTQAEDLAGAFAAFDLSTAVQQLGEVEGAAAGAISTLGDNAAGQIESARRNIEVATDAIKGAVAAAFSDEIKDAATYAQENRAEIVRWVLDLADGALTMGEAFVEGGASALETMGTLAGAVADVILPVAALVEAIDRIPGIDLGSTVDGLREAALAGYAIEEGTGIAADALRTNLIDNAIVPARQKLDELGGTLIADAEFHDATVKLANDVANIGLAANGSALAIGPLVVDFDRTTAAGKALDDQLRTATDSLKGNLQAAANAGAGTADLTATFEENRDALVNQLTAMGFTTEAAQELARRYGAVPDLVSTTVAQPGMPGAQRAAGTYGTTLRQLPTTRTTAVTIAGADRATRDAQALRDAILGIPLSRTSTVRYNSIISSGGQVPGRAGGGPVWPGLGLTLVGEEGPELVAWGGPGQVIPAGVTQQLMSASRTVGPGDSLGAAAVTGAQPLQVTVLIGNEEFRGYVDARVDTALAGEADQIRMGRV